MAFARKRVDDPHLAEDVVQDSLLKALRSDRKPARNEDEVAWFYRILRRSIIDLYRQRDVRVRALEQFQAELPQQPDAAAERVLCQCVKRLLPGQFRDMLQRIDLDGASPMEAASVLGLMPNNLTVRLQRTRQRMRAELQQRCKGCKVCRERDWLDCTCDPTDGSIAINHAAAVKS